LLLSSSSSSIFGMPLFIAPPALASHTGTAIASFSTKEGNNSTLETDLQHKLLQRLCWEAYLGGGRGSTTLFKSIDVNTSGYISREDLMVFLNSIEGKGGKSKNEYYLPISCPRDFSFPFSSYHQQLTVWTVVKRLSMFVFQ